MSMPEIAMTALSSTVERKAVARCCAGVRVRVVVTSGMLASVDRSSDADPAHADVSHAGQRRAAGDVPPAGRNAMMEPVAEGVYDPFVWLGYTIRRRAD